MTFSANSFAAASGINRVKTLRGSSSTRGIRRAADGAVKTACEQVCPAQAIVFGDLNDPNSRVAARAESRRAYRVLEELNTRPAVRYLKLVRNG